MEYLYCFFFLCLAVGIKAFVDCIRGLSGKTFKGTTWSEVEVTFCTAEMFKFTLSLIHRYHHPSGEIQIQGSGAWTP